MDAAAFHAARRFADTPFGRIAYVERGAGPAALFVHGVPLNGFHWRHQLERLADTRRCIALDLMGLGYSEIAEGQDLSFGQQARMIEAFLDALSIERVDYVGNDSGGGIGQLFAVHAPERLASLTLTNCDVHDNWPHPRLSPILDAARAGTLGDAFQGLRENADAARSPAGLGVTYADPVAALPEQTIGVYLGPLVKDAKRKGELCRYFAGFDCKQTVEIESQLRELRVPTQVIWGDDDVFFDVEWAHWLARSIPGFRRLVLVPGGHLFFPEEQPALVERELRAFWAALDEQS